MRGRAIVVVVALGLAVAPPLTRAIAHGTGSCAQMRAATGVMQREVDGFRHVARLSLDAATLERRNARRAAEDRANARRLSDRADVEQSRVDGLRHNALRCPSDERG